MSLDRATLDLCIQEELDDMDPREKELFLHTMDAVHKDTNGHIPESNISSLFDAAQMNRGYYEKENENGEKERDAPVGHSLRSFVMKFHRILAPQSTSDY